MVKIKDLCYIHLYSFSDSERLHIPVCFVRVLKCEDRLNSVDFISNSFCLLLEGEQFKPGRLTKELTNEGVPSCCNISNEMPTINELHETLIS